LKPGCNARTTLRRIRRVRLFTRSTQSQFICVQDETRPTLPFPNALVCRKLGQRLGRTRLLRVILRCVAVGRRHHSLRVPLRPIDHVVCFFIVISRVSITALVADPLGTLLTVVAVVISIEQVGAEVAIW